MKLFKQILVLSFLFISGSSLAMKRERPEDLFKHWHEPTEQELIELNKQEDNSHYLRIENDPTPEELAELDRKEDPNNNSLIMRLRDEQLARNIKQIRIDRMFQPVTVQEPVQNLASMPLMNLANRSFFESNDIRNIFKNIFTQEKGRILAAYTLVDNQCLAKLWAQRKDRNDVDDILIVDKSNLHKNHSQEALRILKKNGVKIFVREKPKQPSNQHQQMNQKFMVIYDEHTGQPKLVIAGGGNLTDQAYYHLESLHILSEPDCIKQYIEQHEELRKYSRQIN